FGTILGRVGAAHEWKCHAFCLMTTHYHLIVETERSKLSRSAQGRVIGIGAGALRSVRQGLSPDGDCPFNRWRPREDSLPSGTVPTKRPGARFRTPGPRQFVYESTQSKVRVTAFFQSASSLSRSAGSISG